MTQKFFVRLDKLNMYMKILDLPLKKEWYNMIESGIKTEEYRELKPFWANRLLYSGPLGVKEYWESVLQRAREFSEKHPFVTLHKSLIGDYGTRGYTHIRFRYGYTKKTMLFELSELCVGKGNKEWGAPEEEVFILKLGNRIWEQE